MAYVKIKDDLFIVEQIVKNENVVVQRNSVNHIWIYDRSGSMSGNIKKLTSQIVDLSKKIPIGDTLTLGWFSSEGSYNFIVKGFKISEESDYDLISSIVEKNNTTLGCTCFSEILHNTKQVIEDLSIFSNTFSLNFFTDGYPVVSNHAKELESIFSAIGNLNGCIDSAMIIGYGVYYNKELMTKMAENLGAMLIHSSMISEYSDSIVKLIDLSGSASSKQEVYPIIKDPISVFTIMDQGVAIHSINKDTNTLFISPIGDITSVYYISDVAPQNDDEVSLSMISKLDPMIKSIYASALVLTQHSNTDRALEVIGSLGDRRFVDIITNSYTIEEYGRVESAIDQAIHDVDYRFKNGRDDSYFPPENAFCVYDVLSKLIEDENAVFYPYHQNFEYNKISKSTTTCEGYSKFVANDDTKCAIKDLVWHETKLNLSVRCTITGTIELQDRDGVKASDLGLMTTYPAFIYRNYSFIKDGIPNITKFYVSTSNNVFAYFLDKGVVVDDNRNIDNTYGIDISKLPAINRAMVSVDLYAKDVCALVKKDTEISGELKALKDCLSNITESSEDETSNLIADRQKEFLLSNGIDIDKGGVYNAKVETNESTDMYLSKKFEIKIKGLSSLPAVKKVVEKIASNKNRTLSESVVEVGITKFEQYKAVVEDIDIQTIWLTKEIVSLKKAQSEIRAKLQIVKFAVLLGKKWFKEFKDRSECVMMHDDWQFTFSVSEEVVKI